MVSLSCVQSITILSGDTASPAEDRRTRLLVPSPVNSRGRSLLPAFSRVGHLPCRWPRPCRAEAVSLHDRRPPTREVQCRASSFQAPRHSYREHRLSPSTYAIPCLCGQMPCPKVQDKLSRRGKRAISWFAFRVFDDCPLNWTPRLIRPRTIARTIMTNVTEFDVGDGPFLLNRPRTCLLSQLVFSQE